MVSTGYQEPNNPSGGDSDYEVITLRNLKVKNQKSKTQAKSQNFWILSYAFDF